MPVEEVKRRLVLEGDFFEVLRPARAGGHPPEQAIPVLGRDSCVIRMMIMVRKLCTRLHFSAPSILFADFGSSASFCERTPRVLCTETQRCAQKDENVHKDRCHESRRRFLGGRNISGLLGRRERRVGGLLETSPRGLTGGRGSVVSGPEGPAESASSKKSSISCSSFLPWRPWWVLADVEPIRTTSIRCG